MRSVSLATSGESSVEAVELIDATRTNAFGLDLGKLRAMLEPATMPTGCFALADLAAAAADDEARVADLTQSAPDAVLVRVPMLNDDVHDLDGLR